MALTVGGTVLTACRKPDPLVGEYSSAGSGAPGGGWTVRLFASGECEVFGAIDGAGTYKTNSTGYELETRIQPRWKGLLMGEKSAQKWMLISFKTNGIEYLVDQSMYRAFERTGDTNRLQYALRRVR